MEYLGIYRDFGMSDLLLLFIQGVEPSLDPLSTLSAKLETILAALFRSLWDENNKLVCVGKYIMRKCMRNKSRELRRAELVGWEQPLMKS